MKEKVKVFKAIGDETRLKILILLSTKNICAKGIAKHLEISEAAVSQHIKVLKEANLIIAYKNGYYVMYELNNEVLEESKNFIDILIHKDVDLISKKYNIKISDFSTARCKQGCKTMKGCCRKKFKEE
ncbi:MULTISPECIES: metalloregulator ArsR/SmtB family transcription factor [unclassified Clostridium]|jgi:ArsR family transcriptional regulator|uniref:ArsR/SmtB family transcription factor n=1 Tax=Clostridium TaxID=1485 RepID=UPI001C8C42D5|nr:MULTISPECIES: metalloregulator ArsR/SmtB family transcription factor [unclassified Clostridium]MBX9138819.1 winged helix-turn-helix transcriptional regulator [Clostridium sp. K12(2020)]MBX9145582.1 winged helix-turn-helix transcriptional regulator [Clostridium sp. K13]MDU4326228.1 metalloregulator ArsR/SmtB family transcription factor [Clostridium celatum]